MGRGLWLLVVLKGASPHAQASLGGSGCGGRVLAQAQRLAAKGQGLHWGLTRHPCLLQAVSAKLLGLSVCRNFFSMTNVLLSSQAR